MESRYTHIKGRRSPAQASATPSICIVAHMAYGAMARCDGHIGGVERQTTMAARWLVQRGWRVSLVTWQEGPAQDEVIDGVQVIKTCSVKAGLPGLRFFHPRWTSLAAALRRADTDLYYHNCAEYVTGQVALWCKMNKRRFVYSVASDPACDDRLPTLKSRRERVLYRYGIRHADRLVVQSRKQQRMLQDGFGLDSIVLPMPCTTTDDLECDGPLSPETGPPRVVWVGRISWMKRLELLLEVAKALPDVRFEVAGRPDLENDYTRGLSARADDLSNVHLLGAVPADLMTDVYRGAVCLCCTSLYEGFPNTFLEAWRCGVPVVSTVDPDDVIAHNELGMAVSGGAQAIAAIRELIDSDRRIEMSRNARDYFLRYHAQDAAMARFEALFRQVVQGSESMRSVLPSIGAA